MSAGLIMSVDGQLGYYTDVALSVTSYNKRTEGTLQNDTAQQTLQLGQLTTNQIQEFWYSRNEC